MQLMQGNHFFLQKNADVLVEKIKKIVMLCIKS